MVDFEMPKSGASEVKDSVLEALQTGALQEGDKLESERAMAARLGVNRTTVREALTELEVRGFVRRIQGSGTFIHFDQGDERKRSMFGSGTENEREFREVMDLRLSLEPSIAFRAAKRSSAEADELADILTVAESLEPTAYGELAKLDAEFHIAIARLSLNPLLVDLLTETHEVFGFTRKPEFQTPSRIRTSLSGHRSILEAIRRGDGARARECMEEHLRDVSQSIVF